MSARRGGLPILLLIAAAGLVAPSQARSLAAAPGAVAAAPDTVTIYTDTLPSPDLGPRPKPEEASVPAQAPTAPIAVASTSTEQKHGSSCGRGCIAGAVVGSVVGFGLILAALLYCCCCCSQQSGVKDDAMSTTSAMSTSDLELLGHAKLPAMDSGPPRMYHLGDEVFCRKGRNCTFGQVLKSGPGDEYTVQLYNGEKRAFRADHLAPNFVEGTEVWYSPPDGRPGVRGTVIQADGSYWPPFYQLTPHGGDIDLVNTTWECLTEATKDPPSHYITAKAV